MPKTSNVQLPPKSFAQRDGMLDLLPDTLAKALGSVVADAQRECRREIEVMSAESRAIVAELKAQVSELQAQVKASLEAGAARIAEDVAAIRNGEPGKDADPQVAAEIAAKLVSDELTEIIKSDIDAIRGDIEAIGAGFDEKIADQVAAAVAGLPVSVDGKDADPAAIAEMVADEVAKLPPPVDGHDLAELRASVIAEIDAALKARPEPVDGRTPTADELAPLVETAVERAVAALPVPADGRTPTAEELALLIQDAVKEAVDALPLPRDGVDGAPGQDGVPGEPGHSVDLDEVRAIVFAEVDDAIKARPAPADGHTPTAEELAPIVETAVRAAVDAFPRPRDGVDGAPGRDGVGIASISREGARLEIELDDGRVFDAGEIVGAKGDRGEAGVGVAGALIDRAGSLIVTQSDGSVLALGQVVGRDGIDGKAGDVTANDYVPDDIAVTVSRAISTLAESPPLSIARRPASKTITTRRDDHGNLIADVVES